MAEINFVDVTLRDGNHTVKHQFSPDLVANTARALDEAGVDIIEVGHGDGAGGSSIHTGRSAASDIEWWTAAVKAVKRAKIGILLVPGFGTIPDLEAAHSLGVRVARIGCHCTEADATEQHVRRARDLGMFTVGYLVSAGMASAERLAEEASKLESYGAQCVNLAESQGHLVPREVAARVAAVRRATKIPVGFHPHNNLGLAVGNILAAIDEGATFIDGSLKGFGGGAGNAQTEVVVAALMRAGHKLGVELYRILDAADVFTDSLGPRPMPVIDNESIMMGFASVYGGYVLPIKKAAAQFGCDPRDLVIRLGERKVVAMQEDVVIEEAQRLGASAKYEKRLAS